VGENDNMGVNSNPDCWSDPAHVELTPMPMVNNAMVSVHAAITVERLFRRFSMVVSVDAGGL
jgi:hypothetical protein